MGAWGWNGAAVRLLFLPLGKNRQDCSYSANSLLFRPRKKRLQRQKLSDGNNYVPYQLARRQKPTKAKRSATSKMPLLRSPSQFAVWQTGADCKFYYHFNNTIFAVRPALARLPLANVLKTCSTLQDWSRTDEPLHHLWPVLPSSRHVSSSLFASGGKNGS